MNKKIKKLVLSRETVRNLPGQDLRGVVGGVTARCAETNVSDCEGTCWSCECTASGCPSRISDCC
jgi:hypothetical protein